MGTNFYVKTKKCKCCKHKPNDIHLGKSSGGWQFTFQFNGGKYYKDIPTMKKWLIGKKITNEYNENVSQKAFWKMVDWKQKNEEHNHAKEVGRLGVYYVIDGYSFSDCEFS